MTPTISIGTALSVAAKLPATYDRAGFQSLVFTSIRGARTIGDIGKQFQLQPNNAIGAPRPVQQRTGLAQQSLAVELYRIADPGQQMLRAAIDAPGSYSYRLVAPDGLTMYFTAAASGRMHGTFQAGSIGDTKLTLEIDSVVVEI
jgi:hypothetical protein